MDEEEVVQTTKELVQEAKQAAVHLQEVLDKIERQLRSKPYLEERYDHT